MEKNYNVLISKEQLQQRVQSLAKKISQDYEGKEPVIICMLKGAIYFFADLCKNITIPIMIDFARLSSYRNGTTSGEMELVANITTEIKNKDVILVEDIVDSGKTLAYFIELLKKKEPASIKICSLLNKKERREVDISVEYVGFEDLKCGFVIGYGLDFAEKFRELNFIAEVIDPSKPIVIEY